jgi:hypothetical protein
MGRRRREGGRGQSQACVPFLLAGAVLFDSSTIKHRVDSLMHILNSNSIHYFFPAPKNDLLLCISSPSTSEISLCSTMILPVSNIPSLSASSRGERN